MPANRFDLVTDVNVCGTYATSRAFVPHLKEIGGGHVLTNAPPINVTSAPGQAAYAWSKMGMTFVTISLTEELRDHRVAANTFWPVTTIDTRAMRYFGLGTEANWRTPDILADAVLELVSREPSEYTSHSVYDEQILREAGVENFSEYNCTPGDPGPDSAELFDPEFERPV